MAMDFSD